MRGLPSLTGSSLSDGLCGFHRVIFTFTFFHFPAKKSVHMGEVGSDPRAGYFFNEVPCPPALRFTISWRTGGLSGEYQDCISSLEGHLPRPGISEVQPCIRHVSGVYQPHRGRLPDTCISVYQLGKHA